MAEDFVSVSHLTKRFGDLTVLSDISFSVRKGEFLCVVGPTGCGKTTFLSCLTGAYGVDSGSILLDGEKVDLKKRNIAYIMQEYSTLPWLTVRQNVAFAVEPELLLMDEPYGQLDIDLRFKLEDELLRLWKASGTTVIFITHNIEEAVYLSQRILILTNKPTSIKDEIPVNLPHPRDVAAADFVALRNRVTEEIKWW